MVSAFKIGDQRGRHLKVWSLAYKSARFKGFRRYIYIGDQHIRSALKYQNIYKGRGDRVWAGSTVGGPPTPIHNVLITCAMEEGSAGVMAADPETIYFDLARRELWPVSLKINMLFNMVGPIRPVRSYGPSAL